MSDLSGPEPAGLFIAPQARRFSIPLLPAPQAGWRGPQGIAPTQPTGFCSLYLGRGDHMLDKSALYTVALIDPRKILVHTYTLKSGCCISSLCGALSYWLLSRSG
jgi:hypothetical protein